MTSDNVDAKMQTAMGITLGDLKVKRKRRRRTCAVK
jgi:hypothetical protein